MKWIETYGGNFICMERNALSTWLGVTTSSIPGYENDYARACNLTNLSATIPLAIGEALVVDSGSMETSIWRDASGRQHIVSVEYSDPDIDEDEHLRTLPSDFFADAYASRFHAPHGHLILFDAADDGQTDDLHVSMVFDVPSGHYDILSKVFVTNFKSCYYVHRFALR